MTRRRLSPPDFTIELGAAPERRERFRDNSVEVLTARGLRANEALMIDNLPTDGKGEFLVIGSRHGVTPEVLSRLNPNAVVVDYQMDHHDAERSQSRLTKVLDAKSPTVVLAADLPVADAGWTHIFLLLSKNDDNALASERIRESFRLLKPGGALLVTVDSTRDTFVRGRVKADFGDVSERSDARRRGRILIAKKKRDREPKAPFRRRFEVREGDDTLAFASRPGTFSVGKLDDGARALIREMEVTSEQTVLDLGCGVGPIGIIAARRHAPARLVMVDGNARALELARENAEANLSEGGKATSTRWSALLTSRPDRDLDTTFDVVLANPPYFSDFKIAGVFLMTAKRVLRPGGTLQLVTKQAHWYEKAIPNLFTRREVRSRGGYSIFVATL